jgi:hypothetical protein
MSQHPFDCLIMRSRLRDLDALFRHLLEDSGYTVEEIEQSELVTVLQDRTRPTVLIRNIATATGEWEHLERAVATNSAVTARHGYVLLTLHEGAAPVLRQDVPVGHDVAMLTLPSGLGRLVDTVERIGKRKAERWKASPVS